MSGKAIEIGIVHPGAMGSKIGEALASAGHSVCWVSEGRSDASRDRADACGLEDCGSLTELCERCGVVISVVPPHGAVEQARAVLDAGFTGCYVDANAVAPSTAREIERLVLGGGASYTDGSIIGPPPKVQDGTRVYLSGESVDEVAALFGGSIVKSVALGGHSVSASALKMCYAAFSKGTTALLANIQMLAQEEGVSDELAAEWDDELPRLDEWAALAARRPHAKAWRYIGEMEEIARAFKDRSLPHGFHDAAARVYERIAQESEGME